MKLSTTSSLIAEHARDARRSYGPDSRGFTLVEILTVIAVIAILAAILIPATSAVQRNVTRSKTRSQFSQWSTAYEVFKADYGYYPALSGGSAEFGLNGQANNNTFIAALSGRNDNGDRTVAGGNTRSVRYYTFSEADFNQDTGLIVDAFDNPNIYVVVDRNLDGLVKSSDFGNLPSGSRPDSLHGGVFFYSSNSDNNPDWEWVYSWE